MCVPDGAFVTIEGGQKMNLFKNAYKCSRSNSDDIYRGFGFKHLSDATQYYVHPNNQSINGTTTLCQPIGEAVVLFSLLRASIENDDTIVYGDYYADEQSKVFFLRIEVPEEYRVNGVVQKNIFSYDALFEVETETITVCAYDEDGNFIKSGNDSSLMELYKILPAFLVILARDCLINSDIDSLVTELVENKAVDSFVNVHEDFYQEHKFDDYTLVYESLGYFDTADMISAREHFKVLAANREEMKGRKASEIEIEKFSSDEFSSEYLPLVPALGSEFVLPDEARGICNAVQGGDAISVLMHGPAGTGKTITCKLICREIGLPIMETVNCTENLDEFVLGKYIPDGDKIIFKESFVTKAIRYGGAVVFEEINFAKPQYLAFLNSLLDDNGFVRLDNGETVRRHKNFRFFATMNMGYFGTKELNQALFNRFNVVLELAALGDDSIKRMLLTRVPSCEDRLDKILGVYHKLKKMIDSQDLDIVISPRNLENWARLAIYEGYLAAAEKTIVPIAKCDRALEKSIRGIIMLYKW